MPFYQSPNLSPLKDNHIVLQINDLKWTHQEWLNYLFTHGRGASSQFITLSKSSNLLNPSYQLINKIIHEEVIKNWAKKRGLSISPSILEKKLISLKQSFPNTEVFNRSLKQRGLTHNIWAQQINNRMLGQKVMETLSKNLPYPTEKEMRKYYQAHSSQFQSQEKALISQIFHKKKSQILSIRQLLKEGVHFEKLQKKFSTKSSKPQWIKKGIFPPFDIAFLLKLNQISPILKSNYGYHIIKILKKQAFKKRLPFEQVKEKITQILMEKRKIAHYTHWLNQQKKMVKIIKSPNFLNSMDPPTTLKFQ